MREVLPGPCQAGKQASGALKDCPNGFGAMPAAGNPDGPAGLVPHPWSISKGYPMTCRLPLTLFLAVTPFMVSPAAAQTGNCAERAHVVERLAGTYGESRQSIGLAANNQVMEVFANLESGSWTVTVTLPSGLTCLVASGMAFEVLEEPLTPTGSAL
jgi:hypothetical protein